MGGIFIYKVKVGVTTFIHVHAVSVFLCFVATGDKVAQKIYKDFTAIRPCVVLTNATHQIGCTCKLLEFYYFFAH